MAEQPRRAGHEPPRPTETAEQHVLCGDALDVLATLPDRSAQTCITSPPYWGLRDYGVSPRVWGSEPSCRHRWGEGERGRRSDLLPSEQSQSEGRLGRDRRQGAAGLKGGCFCRRCGAWKGCLGLEPDPDLYVEHLVSVFDEVHRVLRNDGTLWLNLGDSFAAAGVERASRSHLKSKDLVGIPWRVAFGLQKAGWWLRSDLVWAKPNVMPESVRDRPTRAHEFVFLLSKSPRYFYDSEAVREPTKGRSGGADDPGRNRRSVWTIPTQCFKGAHFATFPEALAEPCLLAGTSPTACSACSAPWRRVVRSKRLANGRELRGSWNKTADRLRSGRAQTTKDYSTGAVEVQRETIGWEPTCRHDRPGARSVVLDPFAGAATTGIVAARHGRSFTGIELSGTYARMARRRLRDAACTAAR